MRLVALSIALLTGCATATMDRVMRSWVGEHIETVVKQWGYPNAEREFRGRKLYVWNDSGSYIIPSHSIATGTTAPRASIGYAIPGACERLLEVDDHGMVRAWQWQGNNCCVMAVSGHCGSLPNPNRP